MSFRGSRHGVKHLVWFEDHGDIEAAITREKIIKRWRRAWKIALIEEQNPQWLDLWDSINAVPEGPLTYLQKSPAP